MAGDKEKLAAAPRNFLKLTVGKKKGETPQGWRRGGAQIGSLWHCCTMPTADTQKLSVSSS